MKLKHVVMWGLLCVSPILQAQVQYPENVVSASCFDKEKTDAFCLKEKYTIMGSHPSSVPLIGDIDGDGFPDVVTMLNHFDSELWPYGSELQVVDGRNGKSKFTINVDAVSAKFGGIAPAITQSVSIADVDRDGKGEIYFKERYGHLYCYDHTGKKVWERETGFDGSGDVHFHCNYIEDLDADGNPELIIGNVILDPKTGEIKMKFDWKTGGKGYYIQKPVTGLSETSIMAFHDFDGDGKLEIAAGSMIYSIDLENGTSSVFNRADNIGNALSDLDGATIVVDFDNDGDEDVVVIACDAAYTFGSPSTYSFYVWDGQTDKILASARLTSSNSGSLPLATDLDGDGQVEIAFHTDDNYYVMKYNPEKTGSVELLANMQTNYFKAGQNLTAFDFNHDGKDEVVVNGCKQLFIADGVTLEPLCEPLPSNIRNLDNPTPVIVDVDNDGETELLVTMYDPGHYYAGKTVVYSCATKGAWPTTRKVWNQYTYNGLNINDDLTVPTTHFKPTQQLANGVKPFNSALKQWSHYTVGGEYVNVLPDLAVEATATTPTFDCDYSSWKVKIANIGLYDVLYPFSFELLSGDQVIYVGQIDTTMPVGKEVLIDLQVPSALLKDYENQTLTLVVNPEGVENHRKECNYANNRLQLEMGTISTDPISVEVSEDYCGDYYLFGTKKLYKSGVYTFVSKSKLGCDSVVSLTLSLHQPEYVVVNKSIKSTEPYTFGRYNLSLSGVYVDTFVASTGCDSIVTLNLSVSNEDANCDNLIMLFREDFGGNNVSDPNAKGSGIPQCTFNYNDNPKGSGNYAIRKCGFIHNQWYYPFYDHTYPNDGTRGYMLQADGSSTAGTFYYTQIDDLCDGSLIYVSFWGLSATCTGYGSDAALSLVVLDLEGNVLGKKDVVMKNDVGIWEQSGMYVKIPDGTSSIIYKVTNNSATSSGNDFFLDDIEVAICVPPATLTQPDSYFCEGDAARLVGSFENDGTFREPLAYRWFFSTRVDAPLDEWTLVDITDGPAVNLDNLKTSQKGYYRMVVSAKADMVSTKCRSVSEPIFLDVRSCSSVNAADDLFETTSCKSRDIEIDILANDDVPDEATVAIIDGPSVDFNTAELQNGKLVYKYKFVDGSADVTDSVKYGITYEGETYVATAYIKIVTTGRNTPNYINTCSGETIKIGAELITIFSDTLVADTVIDIASGCENVVTWNITAFETKSLDLVESICEGDVYNFNGKLLTESGKYADTLTTSLGCDSIVNLSLQVTSAITKSVVETVCIESGLEKVDTWIDTLVSKSGCDSLVAHTVYYKLNEKRNLDVNICNGETYAFNGKVYNEAGVYTDVLPGDGACDTVVTIILKVADKKEAHITASICQGESYTFDGKQLAEPGTYYETTQVGSCDSLTVLTLLVNQPVDSVINVYLCEGDTYLFNGSVISAEGSYVEHLVSHTGCDSTVYLNVAVGKKQFVQLYDTICVGSYTYEGVTNDYVSGEHEISTKSTGINGCDSTTILYLHVHPVSSTYLTDQVCVGEAYTANGFVIAPFAETGSHNYTMNTDNEFGCDSIVYLTLNVVPVVDTHVIPTAFSPMNADGNNDVFMKGYEVYIYDRYGNMICHSTDGWDGRYRGEWADPGVYVYVVTMKDGKKNKGTVEVLKN